MEQLSFTINDGEDQVAGPLDLILNLLSKHKLNIADINISELLEQYMAQIDLWQKQNLEITSEFLEMAAHLVYIKTVSLLPKSKEEEEKAKAELVGRLLEYQACKQAALLLAQQNSGFGSFAHPSDPVPKNIDYKRRHDVNALFACYWAAIGRGKRKLPPKEDVFTPLVAKPMVSVSSKIISLLRQLFETRNMEMIDVYRDSKSKSEVVATFLAVLELIKSGRIATDETRIKLITSSTMSLEELEEKALLDIGAEYDNGDDNTDDIDDNLPAEQFLV